ncbi:bacteriohemerythrin [Limisalsivibrio acetivorans]|uniref:bacteriohemerythrin n=1 Tax=Limisalsivibrio acetivorans TaxID=1304888 RepID=UPI0003B3B721|nr:bacteriohemerythrin [Limisalsivibrio acetivorans]
MRFEWTDSLITGDKIIDSQHQTLFAKVNRYFEEYEKGASHESLIETMNFLVEYVKEHFSHEEKAMNLKGYPLRKSHMESHIKLVEQLVCLYKRLINEGPSDQISMDLFCLAQDWYVGHINNHDKKLASFMASLNKKS